jgi:hypothetical protein
MAMKRRTVLAVKGKAAAVIQDREAGQRLLDAAAHADAAEGIRQGLEDLANGRGVPAREVFDALRAEFGVESKQVIGHRVSQSARRVK